MAPGTAVLLQQLLKKGWWTSAPHKELAFKSDENVNTGVKRRHKTVVSKFPGVERDGSDMMFHESRKMAWQQQSE